MAKQELLLISLPNTPRRTVTEEDLEEIREHLAAGWTIEHIDPPRTVEARGRFAHGWAQTVWLTRLIEDTWQDSVNTALTRTRPSSSKSRIVNPDTSVVINPANPVVDASSRTISYSGAAPVTAVIEKSQQAINATVASMLSTTYIGLGTPDAEHPMDIVGMDEDEPASQRPVEKPLEGETAEEKRARLAKATSEHMKAYHARKREAAAASGKQ